MQGRLTNASPISTLSGFRQSLTLQGQRGSDDTIEDFSTAEGDRFLFDAATSFAQLHLTEVKFSAADAVNGQFASGSVTILGLTVAQLHASDFGF